MQFSMNEWRHLREMFNGITGFARVTRKVKHQPNTTAVRCRRTTGSACSSSPPRDIRSGRVQSPRHGNVTAI